MMPSSPPEPVVSLNGVLVPLSRAMLPIFDLGIVQGATVTERMRTYRHLPRFVDAHLARLERALEQLDWTRSPSKEPLKSIVEEVAAANARLIAPADDLAVVVFVTAGQLLPEAQGVAGSVSGCTVCVYTVPLPLARYGVWHRRGLPLIATGRQAIPAAAIDPQFKNRSRLHWHIADREAQRLDPEAQALLVDSHGYVTETSSGNLFALIEGRLVTPRRETTLGGISQAFVMERLAPSLGLTVERGDLTVEEIVDSASELFLTSSTYCIAPVRSLNGQAIGGGGVGELSRQLLSAWSIEVGIDLLAQTTATCD